MSYVNIYFLYQTNVQGINKRDKKMKDFLVVERIHKRVKNLSLVDNSAKEKYYQNDETYISYEDIHDSEHEQKIIFKKDKWFEPYNYTSSWLRVNSFDIEHVIKKFELEGNSYETIVFKTKNFNKNYHDMKQNIVFENEVNNFKTIENDNKREVYHELSNDVNAEFVSLEGNIFIESPYLFLKICANNKNYYLREDRIIQTSKIENNDKWNKFVDIVSWIRENKTNFVLDLEYQECFNHIKKEFDIAHPLIMKTILQQNKNIYYYKIKDYLDKINFDFELFDKIQNENYSQFSL